MNDLQGHLQGHFKVIYRYYTQTVGNWEANLFEGVCDLDGQGQGQLEVKCRNNARTAGRLSRVGGGPGPDASRALTPTPNTQSVEE
jgi:hypothetical protein